MIQCDTNKRSAKVKVTFTLEDNGHGLEGQAVAVVGDFNDWDPTAIPMARKGDKRVATVALVAGRRYGFRYLTEAGQWINDEAAHAYESNEFGVENSILDLTSLA
ncbi:MAG: isoamylase early set domain-containing protein [Acidimicrobiales bacterium]